MADIHITLQNWDEFESRLMRETVRGTPITTEGCSVIFDTEVAHYMIEGSVTRQLVEQGAIFPIAVDIAIAKRLGKRR